MNTMQNIADRYGAGAHCAISYILDKGYEQIVKITLDDIAEMESTLEQQQEQERKHGNMSLMTASFQAAIVRCAKEIVETVDVNELIIWLKTEN